MTDKAEPVVKQVEKVVESQKTWPDVADKTVDRISDLVVSIRDVLEEQAPHVWKGLVDYHYTRAASELVTDGMIILIIMTLMTFAVRLIRKGIGREKISDSKWNDYRTRLKNKKEHLKSMGADVSEINHAEVDRESHDDGSSYLVGGWVLLVFLTVILCVRIACLPDPIAKAMVPERAAAHEILDRVR